MINAFPHNMTWYQKTAVANVYNRVAVSRVMWQASKVANTAKSGLVDSDKAIVYVPFLDAAGVDRSATLPFKVSDYLVPGTVTENMVDSTFTPTHLLAKYPETVQIRSVDKKNYGVLSMQHFQIGGK